MSDLAGNEFWIEPKSESTKIWGFSKQLLPNHEKIAFHFFTYYLKNIKNYTVANTKCQHKVLNTKYIIQMYLTVISIIKVKFTRSKGKVIAS